MNSVKEDGRRAAPAKKSAKRTSAKKGTATKPVAPDLNSAPLRLELKSLIFPELRVKRKIEEGQVALPTNMPGLKFAGQIEFTFEANDELSEAYETIGILKVSFSGGSPEKSLKSCDGKVHAQGVFVADARHISPVEFTETVISDKRLHHTMASQLYAFAMRKFNELLLDAGLSDAGPSLKIPHNLIDALSEAD